MERPDLRNVSQDIINYIEYLENQLESLNQNKKPASPRQPDRSDSFIANEPPTHIQIISVSHEGKGKRTPRHLYERQHRGGMGIFELDVNLPDFPNILLAAENQHTLLLFTSRARVFRFPLSRLDEAPLRSKGDSLLDRLPLEGDEYLAAILPERSRGNVALASASGGIRCLRHHLFGEHMRPGTSMYNFNDFGPLSAVCWTSGSEDLLLVSRQGMAIRFSEKIVPPQGGLGMKLANGDELAAVTSVEDQSLVFLAGSDGKGALRSMASFAPNKSLGGIGKIAMKNNQLIAAVTAEQEDDIFMITRLGKMIRFRLDEVPTTEGAVQGVNCMALRADEVTAICRSTPFHS